MTIKYQGLFKIVDALDGCINNLFKLLLFPIVLIGAYALYDLGQLELGAIKAAGLGKEYVSTSGDSVDFEALLRKNDEVVAWLRIPDTNIDFPVMKASDNKYYLSHDFERNYAITGGIFLDYRNAGDFSDEFSVIYGHRMSSGRMFSDIGKFEDRDFFESHQRAVLYAPGQKYELRFVAFASVYGVQPEIYSVGLYDRSAAVGKVLENASIIVEGEVGVYSRYVLLSTCSTKEESKRDVLLGVLTEE